MAVFPHQKHVLLVWREYDNEYALDTAGWGWNHVFASAAPVHVTVRARHLSVCFFVHHL